MATSNLFIILGCLAIFCGIVEAYRRKRARRVDSPLPMVGPTRVRRNLSITLPYSPTPQRDAPTVTPPPPTYQEALRSPPAETTDSTTRVPSGTVNTPPLYHPPDH
ncbi:hypothetical protein K493DRAFT_313706 [Basidiobolus meristosporus CBS 931.73]|uniref:Uncharacterized protein n=1 Tax=Basidiobolus meristosporus CBS 931.73 TaxID=1314790 RepID=A0A1Y1YL13_9FUNG|nr:hypothetical protein K493DRAFT_313706 [Basidiobolus meristosporus CBS 931.73]|eukprot:ORX98284.1 hypothetical protein K493DRAFT_313706 [Basidiobolus meristosporus CBS 931.73]